MGNYQSLKYLTWHLKHLSRPSSSKCVQCHNGGGGAGLVAWVLYAICQNDKIVFVLSQSSSSGLYRKSSFCGHGAFVIDIRSVLFFSWKLYFCILGISPTCWYLPLVPRFYFGHLRMSGGEWTSQVAYCKWNEHSQGSCPLSSFLLQSVRVDRGISLSLPKWDHAPAKKRLCEKAMALLYCLWQLSMPDFGGGHCSFRKSQAHIGMTTPPFAVNKLHASGRTWPL